MDYLAELQPWTDVVLDQAFRRIGEMPRELVVEKLYEIFKTDKWKIRRAAAATVLKISTVKHVDEFMAKLPEGKAEKHVAKRGDGDADAAHLVGHGHLDRGNAERLAG